MSFVHEDPEFGDLVRIVAEDRGITPGLVEKDYWVTHTLWALLHQGFELWFRGGTSLSKGFQLIHRFSEDLELELEPGAVAGVTPVANWKSTAKGPVAARRRFFAALAEVVLVPATSLQLDLELDSSLRSAGLRVRYPGHHLGDLGAVFRPFVLLEIGHARVVPFVMRDLSSFVHDHLDRIGERANYEDNRPQKVRCVHPVVTLLEKLDAIGRRFAKDAEPPTFVRHFEDAAQVIAGTPALPPLGSHADPLALAMEMLDERQLAALPVAADAAFAPDSSARWQAVRAAYAAIAPMFWGPRIPLDDACASIRGWIASNLGSK